jgi:hypothetical protein
MIEFDFKRVTTPLSPDQTTQIGTHPGERLVGVYPRKSAKSSTKSTGRRGAPAAIIETLHTL